MSEHVIWHTKPCSVPGHCLLIGPSTDLHAFSVQMPIETAEYIVRACNSHKKLLKACEKVINILRGKDGGHSHSDKIGLRCTVCQCMATGALEAAIAKTKEN